MFSSFSDLKLSLDYTLNENIITFILEGWVNDINFTSRKLQSGICSNKIVFRDFLDCYGDIFTEIKKTFASSISLLFITARVVEKGIILRVSFVKYL